MRIMKVSEEQRIVAGIVYEPDVVDSQGDFADAEEIEKACHHFMMNGAKLGIMHTEEAGDRAYIVENYIARSSHVIGNQVVRKGTWVIAVKVYDDALWADINEGRYTGFSMGGLAEVDELKCLYEDVSSMDKEEMIEYCCKSARSLTAAVKNMPDVLPPQQYDNAMCMLNTATKLAAFATRLSTE